MQVEVGAELTVEEVNGEVVRGRIEYLCENTVILSNGMKRYVVRKSTLVEMGYHFPEYKKSKFC